MPVEFKMPDPGEGIHEAEVLEINVSEGDRVEEGQTVMLVETDKASVEVPAPVTGKVKEIRVAVGDVVKVGEVLMVFVEADEKEDEAPAGDRKSEKKNSEEKKKEKKDETEEISEEEREAASKEEKKKEKKEGKRQGRN